MTKEQTPVDEPQARSDRNKKIIIGLFIVIFAGWLIVQILPSSKISETSTSPTRSNEYIYDHAKIGMTVEAFFAVTGDREPDDKQEMQSAGMAEIIYYYGSYQYVFDFNAEEDEEFKLSAINSY